MGQILPFKQNFIWGIEYPFKQGDPPYLFLLAVETLAIAIRENKEIKEIVINKQGTKLLHADDTTTVLSDTKLAYEKGYR